MPNGDLAREFVRLESLPEAELLEELVKAVQEQGELMALMPETVPPMPFTEYSFAQKIEMVEQALDTALELGREEYYETICVRLRFCYCKKKAGDKIALLVDLLDGLLIAAHPWLFPVPILVHYLYKAGKFDKLCGCPPED